MIEVFEKDGVIFTVCFGHLLAFVNSPFDCQHYNRGLFSKFKVEKKGFENQLLFCLKCFRRQIYYFLKYLPRTYF